MNFKNEIFVAKCLMKEFPIFEFPKRRMAGVKEEEEQDEEGRENRFVSLFWKIEYLKCVQKNV